MKPVRGGMVVQDWRCILDNCIPFFHLCPLGFRRARNMTWKLLKGFRYVGIKTNSVFVWVSFPEQRQRG